MDGHEREDVVEHRGRFLEQMLSLEQRMGTWSGEEMDVYQEPANTIDKRIVMIVHNESIFCVEWNGSANAK